MLKIDLTTVDSKSVLTEYATLEDFRINIWTQIKKQAPLLDSLYVLFRHYDNNDKLTDFGEWKFLSMTVDKDENSAIALIVNLESQKTHKIVNIPFPIGATMFFLSDDASCLAATILDFNENGENTGSEIYKFFITATTEGDTVMFPTPTEVRVTRKSDLE